MRSRGVQIYRSPSKELNSYIDIVKYRNGDVKNFVVVNLNFLPPLEGLH